MKPLKRDQAFLDAQATMKRIGRELLAESKREIAQNGAFEGTGTGRARDLFSLLVRANTSKDIPENQRLSDEDVIARESRVSFSQPTIERILSQRCLLSWLPDTVSIHFTLSDFELIHSRGRDDKVRLEFTFPRKVYI
jgi:hypothetical protein